ncbi:PP2C family protein-serine/threonine phosphatase [Streptomyces sp. NPDC096339]|uniref:PP2C family protein-serine/threonine phosphatase n=1 Tax=Streptomyces sp. NPDC096339 TaxID=3366086 RepID=UPI00382A7687
MLSRSLPLTLRAIPLAAVLVAAPLAGGISAGAWLVHNKHERIVSQIKERWRPAQAELTEVRHAAQDARAAGLTGGPAAAWQSLEAHGRLSEAVFRLRSSVRGTGEAGTAAAALETAAHQWSAATLGGTAAGLTGARAPREAEGDPQGAEAAAGAVFLAPSDHYTAVDSAADTLSRHLDRAVAAAERQAGSGDTSLLLYLLAWCALTAAAIVLFPRLSVTRVLAPAARIEADLRRAATGTVDDPLAPRPQGWLSRLAHEADRVRAGLSQSRWQARCSHEALTQNGPCATGLHRILTAQNGPGPGIDVHGALIPAEGLLAGDYLDSLALPDGSTALVLGDVTGHGVPAGLLAVQLKCAVQTALRTGLGPVVAAHAAWRALAHADERFSTLLIAVADPRNATLTWLNAGQEQPFLVRADGGVERLQPTGPLIHPLLEPEADAWTTRCTPFRPGDLLVLCTDGLTEGRHPQTAAEFGEQRVATTLAATLPAEPVTAVAALYHAAEAFGVDWSRDDVTVLAAACTAPATA